MPQVVQDVISSCDTSVVNGLSSQIITTLHNIEPQLFVPFNDLNVQAIGNARLFVQSPAKTALRKAIQARGVTLRVNSAYRTIAQQYMLYQQYLNGWCGVTLAARPSKSNHEDALAIDIQGYQAWKPYLVAEGWNWQGSSDKPHFHYDGDNIRNDVGNLGVLAFQKLWNQHNPADRITEDGLYGPQTEKRLKNSPISGF